MPNVGIDRHALHQYLYTKADPSGRLRILQVEFADEIGCTKYTLNRLLKELETAGRIRRVSRRRATNGLYKINDPAEFEEF